MTVVAHVTDLHLDVHPYALDAAVNLLRHEQVDVIVLGGDNVGEERVEKTAFAFRRTHPHAAFAWVMGNHDLWARCYTDVWSAPRLEEAHYLETGNHHGKDWTVVGTYGHYDYSAGDPTIPVEAYAVYQHQGKRWMDWQIDHQGRSDPQIAAELADAFAQRYAEAIARGKPIVVVMHTLPDGIMNAWPRSFWSAYGANSLIGATIRKHATKPAALFCGHTHKEIVDTTWGFPMVNPGSDYGRVRVALLTLETGECRILAADGTKVEKAF